MSDQDRANLSEVDRSVVKNSAPSTVDKPSRAELDALVAERNAHPKVHAYELADRLAVSPSAVSTFENGRAALPRGMGVKSYRSALADLKRAKRQGAAA